MAGTLVDSNVLLDVFADDPTWYQWSASALRDALAQGPLWVDAAIYAEVSTGFTRIEELERALVLCACRWLPMPREACFLAGKAWLDYRRRGGTRMTPLPDFYIGAHAAVSGLQLVTRDARRYATYFPGVALITPTTA